MSIITKTGDQGETALFDGKRVTKTNPQVEAIGAVDELNAVIGMILSEEEIPCETKESLQKIQNDLFVLGAVLAGDRDEGKISELKIALDRIETSAKLMEAKLPTLKNFILPGGHKLASFAHFARTVCRRAEIKILKIAGPPENNSFTIPYLNRLSDFLFLLARYFNFIAKTDEVIWKK